MNSYLVGVEDRDGLLTPSECECPADKYNEEYDCKHKVALGTIGGPVILEASAEFQTESVDTNHPNTSTLSDKLRIDGGATTEESSEKRSPLTAVEFDECEECAKLSDLKCWPCAKNQND